MKCNGLLFDTKLKERSRLANAGYHRFCIDSHTWKSNAKCTFDGEVLKPCNIDRYLPKMWSNLQTIRGNYNVKSYWLNMKMYIGLIWKLLLYDKLSCTPWRHVAAYCCNFILSPLHGVEWSLSCSGRLITGERPPVPLNSRLGGSRVGLDPLGKR